MCVCARACRLYLCVWPCVSHAVAQVRACATQCRPSTSALGPVYIQLWTLPENSCAARLLVTHAQDRSVCMRVLGVCTTAPTAALLHLQTCSALRWRLLVRCCCVVLPCRPVVLTLGMVLAVALWSHVAVVVPALASSAAVTHPRHTCASPQLLPCCTLYQHVDAQLCRGVLTPKSRPTVALLSVAAWGARMCWGAGDTSPACVRSLSLGGLYCGTRGHFHLCFVDHFKLQKLLLLSSESSLCI